jgi:hypothetical protein
VLILLIEWIKDKWLTWRTGKSKAERDWLAWYEANVVYRAGTIPNMFMHFEHVIIVDSNKFMVEDPFSWGPCADAKQYFWPARELGDNAVWRFERVRKNQFDNIWHINELGGEDKVFVATNNSKDAMMIALRWS